MISPILKSATYETKNLFQAAKSWSDDSAAVWAASISYYAALSFFPLIILLIAMAGLVLKFVPDAQSAESALISTVQGIGADPLTRFVKNILDNMQDQASMGGPVGFIGLLFAGGGIFVQLERSFSKIWHIDENSGFKAFAKTIFIERLRSFVLVILVGGLLLTGTVSGIILEAFLSIGGPWVEPLQQWQFFYHSVNFIIYVFALALLFKYLPRKPINWSSSLKGALATSFLWVVVTKLMTLFAISDKYSIYGLLGSFVALLFWVFVAMMILLYGAEYVKISNETRPRH